MKEKFNESIVCLLWRGEVGTLPDISFGYGVVLRGLMLGFSSPGSRGVLFREIRKPLGSIFPCLLQRESYRCVWRGFFCLFWLDRNLYWLYPQGDSFVK